MSTIADSVQHVIIVFIATLKIQIIPRELTEKIIFVIVREKSIWGIKEEWINSKEKIRISNIEKTIIDCLTYPQYYGEIYVKDRYNLFDPTLSLKRINKNSWRLINNVVQKQIKNVARF